MRKYMPNFRDFLVLSFWSSWAYFWLKFFGAEIHEERGIKSLLLFCFASGPLFLALARLLVKTGRSRYQRQEAILKSFLDLETTWLKIEAIRKGDGLSLTLYSLDGGINWYVAQESPERGVESLKDLKNVEPSLMDLLTAARDTIRKDEAIMAYWGPSTIAHRLVEIQRTHLWIKGNTNTDCHYELHSFDGGKNWYAIKTTKSLGVMILGLAEEVYPGLLKEIFAIDQREWRADCLETQGFLILS